MAKNWALYRYSARATHTNNGQKQKKIVNSSTTIIGNLVLTLIPKPLDESPFRRIPRPSQKSRYSTATTPPENPQEHQHKDELPPYPRWERQLNFSLFGKVVEHKRLKHGNTSSIYLTTPME